MEYILKFKRFEHEAGTRVYDCCRCDYGLRNDDERVTGVEHKFVTLNPDGEYPGFTAPVTYLEKTK